MIVEQTDAVKEKIRAYLEAHRFHILVDNDNAAFWGVVKQGLHILTETQCEELNELIKCQGAVH